MNVANETTVLFLRQSPRSVAGPGYMDSIYMVYSVGTWIQYIFTLGENYYLEKSHSIEI